MGYILLIIGLVLSAVGITFIYKGKDSQDSKTVAQVVNTPIESSRSSLKLSGEDATSNQERENNVKDNATPLTANQELSSKEKGDLYEDFVVNLLADWRLTLLDRTQDKVSSSGVYAESCKNPDLHVKQKRGKSEVDYYIECKYRSKWDDKGVVSLEEWQIQRYREFQRSNHRKVLIALGVGGTPSSPATFMVVPVDSIKSAAIRRIDTHFALPCTSDGLVSYIDDYFTTVFKKGSARKSSSDSRP